MNPNHVELARIYSHSVESGDEIADEPPSSGSRVGIAVDCRAGATIFGLGVPFTLTIHVRDLMGNFKTDHHTETISGTLGGADWPTLARTHEFRVGGPFLHEGHVFDVLAVLTVGAGDPPPIAGFALSKMFLMA
jgi:hypothetical protein